MAHCVQHSHWWQPDETVTLSICLIQVTNRTWQWLEQVSIGQQLHYQSTDSNKELTGHHPFVIHRGKECCVFFVALPNVITFALITNDINSIKYYTYIRGVNSGLKVRRWEGAPPQLLHPYGLRELLGSHNRTPQINWNMYYGQSPLKQCTCLGDCSLHSTLHNRECTENV